MRQAPQRSPAPVSRDENKLTSDERTYRFLTPVFGGGVRVESEQSWKKLGDPRTPVRVPSIRGQLRFWWRACNPQRCRMSKQLFAEEAKIFGSTSEPSPLRLSVLEAPGKARDVHVYVPKDRFRVVHEQHGRAYGAFPLRDTGQGTDHGVLHEYAGDWTLALSYPAVLAADIEAAFWAWAHFGGLGGRTRRGFGAIGEVRRGTGELLPIDAGWQRYVTGLEVPWPHLPAFSTRRLLTKSGDWKTGAQAQEALLVAMRRLRQGEIGRRPQPDDVSGKRPGRSYWPEPDAIRGMLEVRSRDHAKPVTAVAAFPRAVFGMPIIFDFKDDSDPPKTTLLPSVDGKTKGRLASPLILRPHCALDGSIEALALVLAHPAPTRLVLSDKKNKQKPEHVVAKSTLTESEAQNLGLGGRPSPLVTKSGDVIADPINRFLEEIR